MKTVPSDTGIRDCHIVPVTANPDDRGCLYEIFRESWRGAFPTVQWNACTSDAGVARGAHVHVDFQEFYTLPRGRVIIGLSDIRRDSPTFGHSVQFEWADRDAVAVVVPQGVVHVVLFEEPSLLVFGLSSYWRADFDNIGCQWNAPEFGFEWPNVTPRRSERDKNSGSYQAMLQRYEERAQAWAASVALCPVE